MVTHLIHIRRIALALVLAIVLTIMIVLHSSATPVEARPSKAVLTNYYSDTEPDVRLGLLGDEVYGSAELAPPSPQMWYRLTNQFLGEGRALDTYGDGDNAPFMAQTDYYTGQYWKLTPIEPIR
jgi:hypothetical protein